MHIPSMITDLAIMLITAAFVTILFRQLKLPTILGYIVAGFLISPYFPFFLDVESKYSIETWSEIGIIIILFHIGLDFNLQKLARIGSTAIVTALVKMSGVLLVGFLFGQLLGLSNINSVFLGAMLSISSTVVIEKSLTDLGLKKERFGAIIMGELIMEDVLSVVIMLLLTTLTISKNVDGSHLMSNLAVMAVYIAAWLLLGIFFLPTFLNNVIGIMSDEMLTVLSLGICFGMALLADAIGMSVELGAFIAGSLFAGTVHVEKIQRLTSGIKDLFGAIFFLSVGMMVDPHAIADHWMKIVPIAIVAVMAKLVFATIGLILSGQDLRTAVKGGTSLAPIGEFSFIIASLGISLGVMNETLYPIIVAASVLTILITPYFISHSGTAVRTIERILPGKLLELIKAYTSDDQDEEEKEQDWAILLKTYFKKVFLYGLIMIADVVIGIRVLAPALRPLMGTTGAHVLTCVIIYIIMALFLRPMLDFHSVYFTHLWLDSKSNRPPLVVLVIAKLVIVGFIAYIPIYRFFRFNHLLLLFLIMVAILIAGRSKIVLASYLQLETRFLRNLNDRVIGKEEAEHGAQKWLDEDISIISFFVPEDAPYSGRELKDLDWGRRVNIYIVKVRRGEKSFLLPSGTFKIYSGDKIYVVGDKQSLETFYRTLGFIIDRETRTLKQFMETDYPDTENALACLAIKITGRESYAGKTIRSSDIKKKYKCIILGVQKNGLPVVMPDSNMLLQKDDILWVIGSNNNVGLLAALSTETLDIPGSGVLEGKEG